MVPLPYKAWNEQDAERQLRHGGLNLDARARPPQFYRDQMDGALVMPVEASADPNELMTLGRELAADLRGELPSLPL